MNRFASFPRPLGLVIALGLAACTGDAAYGAGAGGGGGYAGVPASAGNVVPAAVVPGATTPDGGLPTAETYWLQLSSDDSTSMASAQIAKLTAGETPPLGLHRHEVVNYYDPPPGLFDAEAWPLRATPAPTVQLGLEVVLGPEGATPRTAELLLHLEAAPVPTESRRPWNLVYCVDVSGSMTGEKIDFVRDGLLRSLEHLRAGDRVSFVTFETKAQAIFEALRWPEDEARIRRDFAAIVPLGSTNMIEGLNVAYRMAGAHQAPDRLTRVLLFGDGLANVGETDVERFRSLTRNGDQEGLYLTAVGVGYDFDWNMMDRLADAGKGASVFLPNAAETAVVFDTHFPKLVEVAEDEVEIELVLPVGIRLVDFSGEETSTDPNARVPSIILAAGELRDHRRFGARPARRGDDRHATARDERADHVPGVHFVHRARCHSGEVLRAHAPRRRVRAHRRPHDARADGRGAPRGDRRVRLARSRPAGDPRSLAALSARALTGSGSAAHSPSSPRRASRKSQTAATRGTSRRFDGVTSQSSRTGPGGRPRSSSTSSGSSRRSERTSSATPRPARTASTCER